MGLLRFPFLHGCVRNSVHVIDYLAMYAIESILGARVARLLLCRQLLLLVILFGDQHCYRFCYAHTTYTTSASFKIEPA